MKNENSNQFTEPSYDVSDPSTNISDPQIQQAIVVFEKCIVELIYELLGYHFYEHAPLHNEIFTITEPHNLHEEPMIFNIKGKDYIINFSLNNTNTDEDAKKADVKNTIADARHWIFEELDIITINSILYTIKHYSNFVLKYITNSFIKQDIHKSFLQNIELEIDTRDLSFLPISIDKNRRLLAYINHNLSIDCNNKELLDLQKKTTEKCNDEIDDLHKKITLNCLSCKRLMINIK